MPKERTWKELAEAVGVDLGPEEVEPELGPEPGPGVESRPGDPLAGLDPVARQVLLFAALQLRRYRDVTFRRILVEFPDLELRRLDAIMDEGVRLGLLRLDEERTLAMRVAEGPG